MNEAKFKLGDKVKFLNDKEVSDVLVIHLDDKGYWYTLSSKAFDMETKEVTMGVKYGHETELELAGVEAPKEEVTA